MATGGGDWRGDMASDDRDIGAFTVDAALGVRTWDSWMERVTGIAAEAAHGRPLAEIVPELERRGLLDLIAEVIAEGHVHVLAPAFHKHLIACPPARPSRHFDHMQQRVTIGPLREGARVIGAIVTIEDVTGRLERERDAAERAKSASTLGGAPAGDDSLRSALRDTDWRTRRKATDGMARAPEQLLVSSLLAALREEHDNFSVVSSALQLLSQMDLDVVEPLVEFMESPDPSLRIQAALGLGEQQDARAVPALIAALEDEDANVRFHAVEALGKLRATAAVDRLLEIAHSGDFFLGFAALDALARMGDARVAPLLVPLLENEMLRSAVVDTLGSVGDEESAAALVDILERPDAPIDAIVQGLVSLHHRATEREAEASIVSDRVRQRISPRGVQALVDAADTLHGQALRSLAIVLGWLDGQAVERTLARLLGDSAVHREVVEALVRFGPRVTDLLIQQLAAPGLEARQAAVIAIGRIGDRRATGALLDLLDRDRETMLTTAGALAKIGDPVAFERLLDYVADEDAAVRQAVIAALNSIGHPDMAGRVTALLVSPNPRARESAVRIAGYFGYPQCADAMVACCQDAHEDVRRAALEHLPFVDDPRVVQTLIDALHRDTPRARAAAAHALARVEDEAAVSASVDALGDDDAWVRYFAARTIGHHRVARATPALRHVLAEDPAMQVRLAAVQALGEIGTREAVAILAPLTADEGDVGVAALRALGAVAHADAWPPLRAALGSADPRRRVEVVRALALRGGGEAASLLEWVAAAGTDPAIVGEAIEALGRLARAPGGANGTSAVQALINLTADPVRREASVVALGSLPARQVDRVAGGLSDPRVEVRCAVAEALARMCNEHATSWLWRALDDRAPDVRRVAATRLGRLGSRGPESRLAALARTDPDASVRHAARAALGHSLDSRSAPDGARGNG